MSHRLNRGNASRLLLGLLAATLTNLSPVSAHKVEISGDVGATLHVEPNDNPQAGKAALTWFALTRKGGEVIPLEQCDCELAVFAEPQNQSTQPLLQPPLKPVSSEGYKNIPGAEIVFPKPGTYQVQLKGNPKAGASFKPFELNFNVTVASRAR